MNTVPAERSLAVLRPDLAAQWHPRLNGGLRPTDVSCGLGRKVWWLCARSHPFEAAIGHRAGNGSACPYCSGRKVLTGYNDMVTTHPDLAAQWHPTRNEPLRPELVNAGANVKRWWRCADGHEWEALSSHRAGPRRVGCPYCAHLRVEPGRTDLGTTHPNLAAEWHPERNSPLRPSDVVAGTDRKLWWLCSKQHPYEVACSARSGPRRAGCPYCAGRKVLAGFNDLGTTHPELSAQWHPTRNRLAPTQVSRGTARQVWWLCERDHAWRDAVVVRTGHGAGCPACDGRRRTVAGLNDLGTTHPELAEQWHPTRNGELAPSAIMAGSAERVWWQCVREHSWEAACYSRTSTTPTGCPYCSNSTLLVGFNDLSTTNPPLAAQWHPSRNGQRRPQDVLAGSARKAWWLCAVGHEWESVISSRANGARSCPICSGRQVLAGYNDLATTHPHLTAQWHLDLNEPLRPSQLTAGSGQRVWWKCEPGHQWRAQVGSRTGPMPSGCPYCTNKAVLAGYNDLATTHPELAAQWHPTRNGPLTIANVSAGSGKRFWWLCPVGHEWPAMASNRARLGVGCPDCAPVGFKPNSPGATYVVTDGAAHKIGVMGWDSQRLNAHRQRGWRHERTWLFTLGRDAYTLEQEVVRRLREELRLPPAYLPEQMPQQGSTETVAAAALDLHTFCALVDDTLARLGLVEAQPAAGQLETLF